MDNIIIVNSKAEKKTKKARGRPKGSLNKKIKGAVPSKEQKFRVEKSFSENVLAKETVQDSILEQIQNEIKAKLPQAKIAKNALDEAKIEIEPLAYSDPNIDLKARNEWKLNRLKTKKEQAINANEMWPINNAKKKASKQAAKQRQKDKELFERMNTDTFDLFSDPQDEIKAAKAARTSERKRLYEEKKAKEATDSANAAVLANSAASTIQKKAKKYLENTKNYPKTIEAQAKAAELRQQYGNMTVDERIAYQRERKVLKDKLANSLKNRADIKKAKDKSALVQAQFDAVKTLPSYNKDTTRLSTTKAGTIDNRVFGNRSSAIASIQKDIATSSKNIRGDKINQPKMTTQNRMDILTTANELAQNDRQKARVVVEAALQRSGLFQ